jgi:cytochrome c
MMKWVLAAGFALAMPVAASAQDIAVGEELFRRCRQCHQIGEGAKDLVGPNLNGVVGRKAGSLESFADKYSPAVKAAGAGGLVWTEDDLHQWVMDDDKKIPGNKMLLLPNQKIKDEAEAKDLVAYLKTFGPDGKQTKP